MNGATSRRMVAVSLTALMAGCATLQNLLQPPRFSAASGRSAQIHFLLPSSQYPAGGATVRLWARVQNPNGFGVTLTQLAGNLFLQNTHAGDVDLPLGLPLTAQADTVVPLDISVSFADLPQLANVAARAVAGQTIDYRLDGRVTLNAPPVAYGATFGPSTWLTGKLQVTR